MSEGARILVVDDDANSRYMLVQQLRRLGYPNALEADSGEQALRMASSAAPDLILLDAMMAGMDGLSVLHHLREVGLLAQRPVIMISASHSVAMMARSIELGAEDYMVKPVDRVMLGARIQATLEKQRLRRVESAFASHFDPATGLPNRTTLLEKVDLYASSKQPYALAVLVLRDHAARALGRGEDHASRVLLDLARHLRKCGVGVETMARVADDTLAWLVGGSEVRQARVLEGLEQALAGGDGERPEGAPMATGGVVFVDPGYDGNPQDVLRLVTSAAVNVPLDARQRVVVASHGLRDSTRAAMELYQTLERALHAGELVVYYQPQYATRDLHLSGAESLLRWEHPQRGVLAAGQFLHVAERGPLMEAIDRHVLTQVSQTLNAWGPMLEPGFVLGVNVTASSLVSGVPERVLSEQLDPCWAHHLQLEITEHAVIEDVSRCVKSLEPLRRLGVGIALDDFGTGFSSISHLHQIPCEALKIDRSFVDRVDERPQTRKLLQAMVAMAHSLGLAVIAEGVERRQELDVLRQVGCEHVQGFMLSRAVPAATLRERLRDVAHAPR